MMCMSMFQDRARIIGSKNARIYKVKAVIPRGRPKKTWSEVVEKKLSDPTTTQGRCYGL